MKIRSIEIDNRVYFSANDLILFFYEANENGQTIIDIIVNMKKALENEGK